MLAIRRLAFGLCGLAIFGDQSGPAGSAGVHLEFGDLQETGRAARCPVLDACDGTSAQRWQVGTNGELVNTASGRCLDDTGWRTASGTLLQIWACSGGSEQHWIPVVNPVSGKCVADVGDATAGGSKLTIQACQAQDPGDIWHVM